MTALPDKPKLRRVEAFPVSDGEARRPLYVIRDPCGLAQGLITLSPVAMLILSLMDGENDLLDIQELFARHTLQLLPRQQLEDMVRQLDEAHFLDSPAFEAHYNSLVEDYRAAPARVSGGEESFGAAPGQMGTVIRQMLFDGQDTPGRINRKLVGLVAPHLDYPRGAPAYSKAYRLVAATSPPRRVIILGTNHFGQSSSVVATRKDFQTPLGTTKTDGPFIESLEKRLGTGLCEHEFDHQREHSVELQLLILQHLLGPERFEIVPVLCPDVCGPTGTAPYDGRGADLHEFGEAVGELVRADGTPTLIVAGADLSHVGGQFGDQRDLEATFLQEVERKDREALDALVSQGCEAFVKVLKARENDTRVCSAGCIYAMMTALPGGRPELLTYHQAANPQAGNGVTCAAIAVWEK
ncbi:MAG: AmmeMemoRadiSam system protein B [Phycisphaerae bacterium]|nr:AmmeMemoRadiSam system protein B [Phycisphaerae bacterium]